MTIDTDKYEGHAQGEWTTEMNDTYDECAINIQDYGTIAQVFYRDHDKLFMATSRLIADAPDLLAEVKRLRNILRTVSLDIRPEWFDSKHTVEWYQKLREEYGGEVE